jgi:hypothetical protein
MSKKRVYSCEGQLTLFDFDILPIERETPEEMIENLRHGDVYRYRTKTIKAGNLLECEIFPLWATQKEAERAKKAKPSRKAQENLNHKNTKKKIMRLTNANFANSDLWGTFGYDDENLPATPEAARKDMVNYIRRIKSRRKKLGLPALRYIYTTEWREGDGDGNEAIRCHHHVIMSGDMDRDEIERLWKGGAYPQTRRLRVKEDCGLNGLAAYLSKGSRYEKMWGHSTNLKAPVPSFADRKITPKQAARIALDENAAPALFEKICKGYAFRNIEIKRSEWVAGVYIYVQMYKKRQ